jgi:tryptophanyl-tRNA synthetase
MSKSYRNEIRLSESPEKIRQKIMPMKTDPARKRRTDPGNPALCPVFEHHKVFTDEKGREWASQGCRTAGIGCVDCKRLLLDNMLPIVEPLYETRVELENKPGFVKEILLEGSSKARSIARQTLDEARQAMKLKY